MFEDDNIVPDPAPIDLRLMNYKGVYNRLAQGETNDPMHKNQGMCGKSYQKMFDIDDVKYKTN